MLRSLTIFIILFGITHAHAQDSLLDQRDSTYYATVDIENIIWMADNLNITTALSREPNDSVKAAHNLDDIAGRYYQLSEIDSVCPTGWRIPDYTEWIAYFRYFSAQVDPTLILTVATVDNEEEPYHHYISGYEESFDVFQDNPLNIQPVGRFQGDILSTSPDEPFGDYWAKDANEEVPGTTHIHIWNPWTTIHSHEHHMDPVQPDKLRRFMVRCVKSRL